MGIILKQNLFYFDYFKTFFVLKLIFIFIPSANSSNLRPHLQILCTFALLSHNI